MISDEDKERVRKETDFVALVSETVPLKQRGGEFWGCCPFHHEKSPSFKINPSTGLWHCFGCGKGGDVFDYICERENLSFPDAIRYLADRSGIELTEEHGSTHHGPKRNRLIDCLTEAQAFYALLLLRGKGKDCAAGRSYLAGRGFGSSVCRRWGLGFAPGHAQLVSHLSQKGFSAAEMIAADLAVERNNHLQDRFYDRVMFPIRDEGGRVIAFGGRVLTDAKPKYLNTKETAVFHKSKHMFAFDRAKETITAQRTAIVSEGYTDVIAMHEAGFTNAVAALGTSFSLDHVRTLSRFAHTIICLFDGDAAGQRAAERAVRYVTQTDADLRCVVLPNNLDPAEFLDTYGPDALREELGKSRPLIDFVFEHRLAGYDLTVPGQRVKALHELASILAPLKNSVLLDGYATRLADALGTNVAETRRAIQQAKPAELETETTPRDQPVHAQQPSSEMRTFSLDERRQILVERELLASMAENLDAFRTYADRLGSFSWTDPVHETIAWAMLATPAGTTPREIITTVEAVVPTARQILAESQFPATSDDVEKRAAFLIDQVDLFSTKRRIRGIKARLQTSDQSQDAEKLFREATQLQRYVNELSERLSEGYE